MEISIRGINKSFDNFPALQNVNLDIHSGELIALLGPSGSGKTTLLRVIAGLEFPNSGQILFGNEDIAHQPVNQRRIGFVFQHYALFKHMTIAENVGFGLRVRKGKDRPDKTEIDRRVAELLELVQLPTLGKRYPAQLSGGQRQRVALARAIATEPRVLLLDEPFGALDAKVRKDLRSWLRELHNKTGYTTIFVTHDQEEALELADRVVVLNKGKIEQVGTTEEVYERPKTPFVFDFLGNVNVLPGTVNGANFQFAGSNENFYAEKTEVAGAADIYVRPHDFQLVPASQQGINATVKAVQRTGALVRIRAEISAGIIEIEASHFDAIARNSKVGDVIRVFPSSVGIFTQQAKSAAPIAVADVVAEAPAEYRTRAR